MSDAICTGACRGDAGCNCQTARDARLFAGESLMSSYCWDGALCDCAATHKHAATGVPCILVAVDAAAGTHRCLGCGLVWTAREYRWQPAHVLGRRVCRPLRAA